MDSEIQSEDVYNVLHLDPPDTDHSRVFLEVVCLQVVKGLILRFVCWLVGLLLYVPATCWRISGTDLIRQFYVLSHWDRSCRSNFGSHPVKRYWHQAENSHRWLCNFRRLAGFPLECQFLSHWCSWTWKNPGARWNRTWGRSLSSRKPLAQLGGLTDQAV